MFQDGWVEAYGGGNLLFFFLLMTLLYFVNLMRATYLISYAFCWVSKWFLDSNINLVKSKLGGSELGEGQVVGMGGLM